MATIGPSQAIAPPWIGMLSVTEDTLATYLGICELCRRHTDHLTQHHLFPRAAVKRAADSGFPFTSEQKNSVAALCWPCHCIVHRLIRADILAAAFHSIDLLRAHGGITAWLRWAQHKSIEHLHSLMIPCPPRSPKIHKKPAQPKIQTALDAIWNENQGGFPRWEGKNSLRQEVRRRTGNKAFSLSDIKATMRGNPEYQEWMQWVLSRRRRNKQKAGEGVSL